MMDENFSCYWYVTIDSLVQIVLTEMILEEFPIN